MKKAILTVGISASGKSTWAAEYIYNNPNTIEINRDNIRSAVHYHKTKTEFSWSTWKQKWEKEVTEIQQDMILQCIEGEVDVIISDTNLNKSTRDRLKNQFKEAGYEVELQLFPITYDEAVKRDAQRKNGVGAFVIRSQWKKWREFSDPSMDPTFIYKYVADTTKPKCLVVDLDGTLAHMNDRGPFEWHRVDEDTVDEVLGFMLSMWLSQNCNRVVFLSGRDEVCRDITKKWITDNVNNVRFTEGAPNAELFMRPRGSFEKDTLLKSTLFEFNVAPYYNVLAVFDDRPSVVRMWHDIGVEVWSTGDQLVEF